MRNRQSGIRIIYIVIAAVLLVILMALFLAERARNRKYLSEYKKILETEEKTKSLESGTGDIVGSDEAGKVYDELKDSIKEGLSGIVCWGDEAMAGSNAGSLSKELSQTVNEELMKQVKEDLKKSGSFELDQLDVPVEDMSVPDEGFHEFMVRSGTHKMILGENYKIPDDKEKKDIVLTDEGGNTFQFAYKGLDKFGKVTIESVEGHFYNGSQSYDENHGNLAFARDDKGKEIEIPEGTEIHTEGAELYLGYIPVLFFEEQDEPETSQWIEGIRDMVSAYNDNKYVIIVSTGKGSDWDKEFSKAFNTHYLRCDKDSGEMKKADYQRLADKVYRKLKDQKAFDEVVSAVDEARKSLEND